MRKELFLLMSNEFYCVIGAEFDERYFKNKDNAYKYLWQQYLNAHGDESESILFEMKEMMNEYAMIDGFGYINVYGFED